MEAYFSVGTSIFLTLLAAALWGSWMQVTKFLNGYPISGIIFWLYTFSFILIWGITLVVAPYLLKDGIVKTTLDNIVTVRRILFGGAIMSMGLYFTLVVIGRVGLLLSTTISGGVGIILGLITSIAEEGLPKGPAALPLVILTAVILLAAGFVCTLAAKSRDRDHGIKSEKEVVTFKVILMMLIAAVLTNGWSIGTAAGTARGFAPVLTCAYMATGSFLSVLLILGFDFTRKKQWPVIFAVGQKKTPLLLGCISALCHYGGNLISIYSMPAVSATLSFLFGRTANVWTIFWGMYHKEFSGIGSRTKRLLWAGILLYFVGVALLGVYQLNR